MFHQYQLLLWLAQPINKNSQSITIFFIQKQNKTIKHMIHYTNGGGINAQKILFLQQVLLFCNF